MTRLTDYFPSWHFPIWLKTAFAVVLFCLMAMLLYYALTTGEAFQGGRTFKRSENPGRYWFAVALNIILLCVFTFILGLRIFGGQR
jgi:hypothetical protein